jgi:hypothetical protein
MALLRFSLQNRHVDDSMGMRRTEITCASCGGQSGSGSSLASQADAMAGHLGHVFEGEYLLTLQRLPRLIWNALVKGERKSIVVAAACLELN